MRLHRTLSVATLLFTCFLSLAGSQWLPNWATAREGLLPTRQVSGQDLIGGADCTAINRKSMFTCPSTSKGGCTSQYNGCNGAQTGQTTTSACKNVGAEICQDTAGKCAAHTATDLDPAACVQVLVPE